MAICCSISALGRRTPRSIWLRYGLETPAAAASSAESAEDESALAPDEAALAWPENVEQAALDAHPRRLALAADQGGDPAAGEAPGESAGEGPGEAPQPAAAAPGDGGTDQPFPQVPDNG